MSARKNSSAFQPGRISSVDIKNRLIRSATFETAATDEGEVTDVLLDIYRNLAQGGIGLIVTGIMGVYSKAIMHAQVRADDDKFIAGLRKIPAAVREVSDDCKIMAQLNHPGRQVPDPENPGAFANHMPPALITALQASPPNPPASRQAPHVIEPTAPSEILDTLFQRMPRELSLEEVEEIIDAFAEGIRRVEEAGFDGVQLHAAHGWLLSSFLSPRTNQRSDRFGGSSENRARIVQEIFERARKKVGEDFPIMIKFNTTDFLPEGTDIEEALKLAGMLVQTGFSALETSGGMWESITKSEEELGWRPVLLPESRTNIVTREQEAYFLPAARAIKNRTDVPIILVGGIKSLSTIEEVLDSGAADFVSMCRPLIRQPGLPNLWLSGEGPDRAECVSCNACLPLGEPLRCRAKKG
jgi:2,4-dienoyl-CoA reductase-like NADH-dependent reductase (Old Yellow Enzyme family)